MPRARRGAVSPPASRPASPADPTGAGTPRRPQFFDRLRRCAAFPLLALAAFAAPLTTAHAETVIWSATLTVGQLQSSDVWGYSANDGYGTLDDTDFTIGSTTYTVPALRNIQQTPPNRVVLTLDTALGNDDIQNLVLWIGSSSSFKLSEATVTTSATGNTKYQWNVPLSLTVVNEIVAVKLTDTSDTTLAQTLSLSSISFFSSPASGDTYTRGEDILISVKFDGNVELSNPHLLRLALTVGSVTEQLPRISESARELVFIYTVKESDEDTDGISVPANALSLNGGAITVPGDPDTAVTLTHSGIADDATHKVDGSIVVIPTVELIVVQRTPLVGDTFRRGETIIVTVAFDKKVKVTGEPQLALTIGTSVRNANLSLSHSNPSNRCAVSLHGRGGGCRR